MKKVIAISKSTIGIKCGDCLFFSQSKKFDKPCKDLGVKHFANAPVCYSPNVYKLGEKNPDLLTQLALLIQDFSASESRIFMSVLKAQTAFEKKFKLKFGQPVMLAVGNPNYLCNYYKAVVIGVSETADNCVFVSSDMNKKQRSKPATLSVYRDSILTGSEWKKKKEYLTKNGMLVDPAIEISKRKAQALEKDDYVPPTIDNAPKEALNKKHKKAKSKLRQQLDGSLEFTI